MNTDLCIPERFSAALSDSPLFSAVDKFSRSVSVILRNNRLPFFPGYTDHGLSHIQEVLATCDRLIPDDVFAKSLFTDANAAVLICATLLHDLAMHLEAPGFFKLVRGKTAHQPIPWFTDSRRTSPDRAWQDLWHDFTLEVRRMSDAQLERILGPSWAEAGPPNLACYNDDNPNLTDADKLMIGEFIRRHHARLAHEMSYYGFPGLDGHHFPLLSAELPQHHDLVGIVARSHGMSLRSACDYLDAEYGKQTVRQRNIFAPFLMALLRVADYLQIGPERAPVVLLKLHDPPSPISVAEWKKHIAVTSLDWASHAEESIYVELGTSHALHTHLQLGDLLQDLQKEFDSSAAVLSERYGRCKTEHFDSLRLAKTRVTSNINEPHLHAQLPYLPIAAGLSADPRILTLLVEPLYGKKPGIGIRELVQNSVDSVREREVFVQSHPELSNLDYPEMDCDVCVELREVEKGYWEVVVTDKGLGMRPEVLRDYFLKAGASFRDSTSWQNDFLDAEQKPRVVRSGRFGIGVFAAFLLGSELHVTTRHVTEREGISMHVRRDSTTTEFRRVQNCRMGTSIRIPVPTQFAKSVNDRDLDSFGAWYVAETPYVKRIITALNRPRRILDRCAYIPDSFMPRDGWRVTNNENYPEIAWNVRRLDKRLVVNGIIIPGFVSNPHFKKSKSFHAPHVSIRDERGIAPLDLCRKSFTVSTYPEDIELALLEDVQTDFIAFLFAVCKLKRFEVKHPLSRPFFTKFTGCELTTLGIFSVPGFFGIGDPWLLTRHTSKVRVFANLAQTICQWNVDHGSIASCQGNFKHNDQQSPNIENFETRTIPEIQGLDSSGLFARRLLRVDDPDTWLPFRKSLKRISGIVGTNSREPRLTLMLGQEVWQRFPVLQELNAYYFDSTANEPSLEDATAFAAQFDIAAIPTTSQPHWRSFGMGWAIIDFEFENHGQATKPHSEIAKFWKKLFGGPRLIPKDAQQQALLREEIFDKNPQIRDYYQDWFDYLSDSNGNAGQISDWA